MPRRQASLSTFSRDAQQSPMHAANRILRAKVIYTDPKSGRVALALNRSGVLRNVPLATGMAGTRTGKWGLPQIWNSPAAIPPVQGGRIYDESGLTKAHDTYALVGFVNGSGGAPVVLAMTPPNAHQLSFDEPNLNVDRTSHDIHTITWTDNQNDLRPPPFGDGGDEDDPYTALMGNWQMIFPDRYQDKPVGGKSLVFGDDYQTYFSIGYHDTARQFGDGQTSANYDNDFTPWQLSPKQQGDKPDWGQKYARGIWLNQRWRARFGIDTKGNIDIHTEGLDWDSTHFTNDDTSEGNITFWSRLAYQGWHKEKSEWVRQRPRHDGKKGKSPIDESVEAAKKTGSVGLKVQRDWDVGVRRSVHHTYVEDFTLDVGDYDTRWNNGVGGVDPGTLWDNTVVNEDFRGQVGTDKIWRGKKEDGYLRSANVSYNFARPQDSLQDGPLTFSWLVDNRQPPIDGETHSDCNWSLTQKTINGNVDWSATLKPTNGSATAEWTLTGDQNDAHYTISTRATDPHNAKITLTGQALHTCTVELDPEAGRVNITAPNGLFVNGTQVTVP